MPFKSAFDSRDFLQRVYSVVLAHQRLYDDFRILGDITLRKILNPQGGVAVESPASLDGTPFEDLSSLNLDTPLQTTAQFQSLRRLRYSQSPLTLQDHLETFYYIILYFTNAHCQHTGSESVSKTLAYIRENYVEGKGEIITRGSDGISALISREARIAFKVIDNEPLTKFLNEALVGIWAWHAHHQVIDADGAAEPTGSEQPLYGEAEGLYLYDHKMIVKSLNDTLIILNKR